MSSFWPSVPDVGPGARATTILTNLQRGNIPTQNISHVHAVDVYQRAGQGDLDSNDLDSWLRWETEGDIDRPDSHGLTMLMWAAAYGQTPTVQMLINRGASLHCKGREGETALHLAASCGCLELVLLLIKNGAQVDPEDENGCSPLMFAAMKNHPHCVNELLLHGADLTRRNVNGDTAISLAMRSSARAAQIVLENSILALMGGANLHRTA